MRYPWLLMNRISLLTVSVLCAAAFVANAQVGGKVDLSKLPPAASKTPVTYATDIKPIFEKSCVRCHGAEKPKARLRMDSLESVTKGSEHGAIVVAGKGAESKLVLSVARITADPDLHMPPLKNRAGILPLTKDEVSLIRAWVDQGAK